MQRRTFVSTLAATSVAAAGSHGRATAQTGTPTGAGGGMTDTAPETGYAPVNGVEMYYEIHGTGEPLVLLHGAFATIALWGPILTVLAKDRQVIALEFEAHGHTADIGRPFRYEQLADDVAGVMEHLGIPRADIVGYSMGGNTGLQLAVRHPDLVRKLVAISANYRSDGVHPEIVAVAQTLTPEAFAGSPPEQAYLRVAPNPDNWPALIEKVAELEAFEWAWPEADIQAIAAPTLLVVADSDSVRIDHAAELFQLLGGNVPGDLTGLPPSQLAILPGATHLSIVVERGDELVTLIEQFLAAPMPKAG